MRRIYTVNSRKFDGTIRRSWKCELVSRDDERIDLVGSFEERVEHPDLGIIEAGTISRERFYAGRWYNYFIFEQPAGILRNYYINVCMPAAISDDSVDYVDLDIDVLVWPNGQFQTLDFEEFEANKVEFGYSEIVTDQALNTVRELERLVARGLDNSVESLHSFL